MRFEDGRFIEAYEGGETFEHGRVIAWNPPGRLVFEMRGRNFHPGETTEVEVRFETVERGTRVTVEHRGWDGLPGDHPACQRDSPTRCCATSSARGGRT